MLLLSESKSALFCFVSANVWDKLSSQTQTNSPRRPQRNNGDEHRILSWYRIRNDIMLITSSLDSIVFFFSLFQKNLNDYQLGFLLRIKKGLLRNGPLSVPSINFRKTIKWKRFLLSASTVANLYTGVPLGVSYTESRSTENNC